MDTPPEGHRGVVASLLATSVEEGNRLLSKTPDGVAWIELRGDRLGREGLAALVRRSDRPTIVTVRRAEDGGGFEGSERERQALLEAALSAGATCIDVEENRGLAGWAATLPPDRVVLSHHGASCRLPELLPLLRRMRGHPAARLKIVPEIGKAADGEVLWALLREPGDRPGRLTAFGTGVPGLPTRVLALSWGAWGTFGALHPLQPTGVGQPSVQELLTVYRAPAVGPHTRRFAVTGRSVGASRSPALHGAGYRAVGLDAIYFPLDAGDLEEALRLFDPAGPFHLQGLGVTVPFKEDAARVAHLRDAFVEACGAANTLLREGAELSAHNTDGPAVLGLARRVLRPRGSTVAILGAGGMARAAAVAFRDAAASVVVCNRTSSRAERVASALGVEWVERDRLRDVRCDVLVQATPLGSEGEDAIPEGFVPGRLLIDAAYGPAPTPLVNRARSVGITAFDGLDLLAEQAVGQFRILTGVDVDSEALAEELNRLRGTSS
jgi:3-dehydroquinate dehydratase/shikimate dehydrogenase